jgi:hypothetical protein
MDPGDFTYFLEGRGRETRKGVPWVRSVGQIMCQKVRKLLAEINQYQYYIIVYYIILYLQCIISSYTICYHVISWYTIISDL